MLCEAKTGLLKSTAKESTIFNAKKENNTRALQGSNHTARQEVNPLSHNAEHCREMSK